MCIAAAIGGATLAGSMISADAAGSAADAQSAAAQQANATQLQMYNQTRADQTPWRTAGGQAVNALSQWYGLGGVSTQPADTQVTGNYAGLVPGPLGQMVGRIPNPGAQPGQPASAAQAPIDFNKVLSSLPGYQFQVQQGQQAVERNLAARGLLASGAAGKALTQYGQGVASDYAQQYVNGLQSLAGLGQTSTQATGAAGANAANQIGSNQIYAGNAAASGYVGQANAINSGLQGLSGLAGRYNWGTPSASPMSVYDTGGVPVMSAGDGYTYNIPGGP